MDLFAERLLQALGIISVNRGLSLQADFIWMKQNAINLAFSIFMSICSKA